METQESTGLEKSPRKSMSNSQKPDSKLAKMRAELLSENEDPPSAGQEAQDEQPRRHLSIQRNSIFNRAMRHKSRGKDPRTQDIGHLTESQEHEKSAQEPPALRYPQDPCSTPTQMGPGMLRPR